MSPYDYDSDWDYKSATGQLKDEDESDEPERTAIQKYKDKKYVNRIVGQEKVGNIAKAAGDKETAEKMAAWTDAIKREFPSARVAWVGLANAWSPRTRAWNGEVFELTREALLKVDSLLHDFFLPQHQNSRYV